MVKPFVSVIIPVYNDPDRIRICLDRLENQTYPTDLYEIIVIDNGSDLKPNITNEEFPHLLFTEEIQPGPSAARNKGIKLARGDVIAFTDADCIPAGNWIEKGVEQLRNKINCGLLAGKVEIFLKDDESPTVFELWDKVLGFRQERNINIKHFGATANVFTYKLIINETGLFNIHFRASEDIEWGNRIYEQGYNLYYSNDVKVKHPARSSFREFYRKQIHYINGGFYLEHRGGKPGIRYKLNLLLDLIPPLISIYRLCKKESFKDLDGIKNKSKLIFLYIFVRYLRVWERLRLTLGGKARY